MVFGCDHSRRQFIKTSLMGSAAVMAGRWGVSRALAGGAAAATRPAAIAATNLGEKSHIAVTAGEDRANLAFKGLKVFEKEIAAAIGDKRIILKPNNVVGDNPLAATDALNLEGILEFLKSIGKTNIIIAESTAGGSTLDGFANYGYNKLASKYNVKLLDLDAAGSETLPCLSETDIRPHPCRFSKILLDPNNFIISACKFKTHDTVVATLSLKNIVVGAPMQRDKRLIHGGGPYGINFNLASFATRVHPHLAVIDGYQGMEGNGPTQGTPVEHRVCVVGLDWLAADRVGLELMGIDPAHVGYLTFCAESKMGQYDLSRIDIVGPALKDHIKTYKLSTSIDQQLQWMQPVKRA